MIVCKVNLERFSRLSTLLSKRSVYLSHVVMDDLKFRFNETENRPEKKLKIADQVPPSFRLIYRAPMKNYILMNQVMCSSGVFLGGITGAYKISQLLMLDLPLSDIFESDTLTPLELGGAVTLSTIFIASLIIIGQRYPLRIYKCENTSRFQYVKYGMIPFVTKKFEIRPGDVTVSSNYSDEVKRIQICYDKANKSGMIVFPSYFRRPSDFLEMIGHTNNNETDK